MLQHCSVFTGPALSFDFVSQDRMFLSEIIVAVHFDCYHKCSFGEQL
uniref:Uncharacterized protein n=1 Tax=Arundo donax TaxID=35708 RepID=A0A0A8YME3_ARUDO